MLREQNEALAAVNERLTTCVAELERRLNHNSGNSNSPLSQDVFGLPQEGKLALYSGGGCASMPG